MSRVVSWGDRELRLTESISVLIGDRNGKYPAVNSLLVHGSAESAIVDPSVTVVAWGGAPITIDAVINSHSHEDHLAGNGLFSEATIHIHQHDLAGAHSLDGLLDGYGLTGTTRANFGTQIQEEFHYAPRPDASGFTNGHVWDLGGVHVEAVHLPGHTRGHSGFRLSGGVFFLSDIDLTGFGPYYGDAWSDLDDFEHSIAQVRDEEADTFVTAHHKGVVKGREKFVALLDAYAAVIPRRHEAMLNLLVEPRSLDDLVAHRFIYRPGPAPIFVDEVERRSAELHVARMLSRGEAVEIEPDRYQAT